MLILWSLIFDRSVYFLGEDKFYYLVTDFLIICLPRILYLQYIILRFRLAFSQLHHSYETLCGISFRQILLSNLQKYRTI